MSLTEQFRQEGRQEGLREEIENINDPAKLTNLLRADVESFAAEL